MRISRELNNQTWNEGNKTQTWFTFHISFGDISTEKDWSSHLYLPTPYHLLCCYLLALLLKMGNHVLYPSVAHDVGYEEYGNKKVKKLKIRRIERNLWTADTCVLLTLSFKKNISSKVLESMNFWSESILEGPSWIPPLLACKRFRLLVLFICLRLFVFCVFSGSSFSARPLNAVLPRALSSVCRSFSVMQSISTGNFIHLQSVSYLLYMRQWPRLFYFQVMISPQSFILV